jgi:hypothetical protein
VEIHGAVGVEIALAETGEGLGGDEYLPDRLAELPGSCRSLQALV